MKGALSLLALPLLAAASPVIKTTVFDDNVAPLYASDNGKHIEDSYIIVLKKHVTHSLAAEHHDWVKDIHTKTEHKKRALAKRSQMPIVDNLFSGLRHTYNIGGGLMGYSGHFDEDVIEEIRRHPDVSHQSTSQTSPMY